MNKTNTATWINWTIDDEEERRECPIYLVGRLQAREMEGESKIDIFADIHFGQIDMKPCNKNPMHHTHTHTPGLGERALPKTYSLCCTITTEQKKKKHFNRIFGERNIGLFNSLKCVAFFFFFFISSHVACLFFFSLHISPVSSCVSDFLSSLLSYYIKAFIISSVLFCFLLSDQSMGRYVFACYAIVTNCTRRRNRERRAEMNDLVCHRPSSTITQFIITNARTQQQQHKQHKHNQKYMHSRQRTQQYHAAQ